jgi:hypothetical protein
MHPAPKSLHKALTMAASSWVPASVQRCKCCSQSRMCDPRMRTLGTHLRHNPIQSDFAKWGENRVGAVLKPGLFVLSGPAVYTALPGTATRKQK